MGARRVLILEGKTYNSLQEACDAYGRDRTTVQWRVTHGMSYEDAILTEPQDPSERTSKPVTFRGKTYQSIIQFCDETGLPKTVPNSAAKVGMSIEDYADQNYFRCGDRYLFSVAKVAEELGVSQGTLYYFRKSNPWVTNSLLYKVYTWYTSTSVPGMNGVTIKSIDASNIVEVEDLWMYYEMYDSMEGADLGTPKSTLEALKSGIDPCSRVTVEDRYTVGDKTYRTFEELCNDYDVSTTTVHTRLNSGMSLEEALTASKANSIVIDGKTYASAKKACEAFGTTYADFNNNRSHGLSKEEAVKAGHVDWRTVNMSKSAVVKPVTVDGVDYESIAAACRAYNVSERRVRGRLAAGYSLEDALRGNLDSTKPKDKYSWRGKSYVTVAEMADDMGVNHITLGMHIRKGRTPEEAYEIMTQDRSVTVNGVTYPSITAAADAYGISAVTVGSRMRKGMSLEDALIIPVKAKGELQSQEITVQGVTYGSMRKAAAAYGINYSAVLDRLRQGWDVDRAFTTPSAGRIEASPIIVEGVAYPSKQAAYDAYNISKSIVSKRLAKGWDIDTAFTAPPERKGVDCSGKHYSSLEECCRDNGVSKARVMPKLDEGMSLEEAIAFVKETPSVRESAIHTRAAESLGITRAVYYRTLKNCDSPEAAVELLRIIYGDAGPITLHDKTYSNLTAACEATGAPLNSVRRAMCSNLSFEKVVHNLYYVVGDRVCVGMAQLAAVIGVARVQLEKFKASRTWDTNDEFVRAIPEEWYGTASREADSLRISRANKNVTSVVRIGDNLFLAECATCHRFVKTSLEEGIVFEHSDTECVEREARELSGLNLSLENIREMVRRAGSYSEAVERYRSPHFSSVSYRARKSSHVENLRRISDRLCIVHCSVCNRDVIVDIDTVELFQHDDDICASHEWEGFIWRNPTIGRPKGIGYSPNTIISGRYTK